MEKVQDNMAILSIKIPVLRKNFSEKPVFCKILNEEKKNEKRS
jgi:hypothetical protein